MTKAPSAPAPVRGLFIAGTDTGVGKTTVAVALARLASRVGRIPIPYKPVETGCAPDAEDARRLWEAARPPIRLVEVCPFPLTLPAAPAAAAAAIGIRLDVAALAQQGLSLGTRGDFLIVEGAGGLLAPYDGASTNADLAVHLGLPVLVVARTALGTINHIALTLSALGNARSTWRECSSCVARRRSNPTRRRMRSSSRTSRAFGLSGRSPASPGARPKMRTTWPMPWRGQYRRVTLPVCSPETSWCYDAELCATLCTPATLRSASTTALGRSRRDGKGPHPPTQW